MPTIPWDRAAPPPGLDAPPLAPTSRTSPRDNSFGEQLRRIDDDPPPEATPAPGDSPPDCSDCETDSASAPSAQETPASSPPADEPDAAPERTASEDAAPDEQEASSPRKEEARREPEQLAAAAAAGADGVSIPNVEAEAPPAESAIPEGPSPDEPALKLDPLSADDADPGRTADTQAEGGLESEERETPRPEARVLLSPPADGDKSGGPPQVSAEEAGEPGAGRTTPPPDSTRPQSESVQRESAGRDGQRPSAGAAESARGAAAARLAAEQTLETGDGGGEDRRVERATSVKAPEGPSPTPQGKSRGAAPAPHPSDAPRSPQPALVRPAPGSVESQRLRRAEQMRFVHRVARAFSVARDRGGELRLRLSPPELGSLHLQIKVRHGVLAARLETETPSARTLLLDNLPVLRERLAEQGVRVEQFDVSLAGRQSNGAPQDGMRNSGHGGAWPPPAARRTPSGDAGGGPRPDEAASTRPLAAPGRLNVIV